jgi:hypothetical protein
LWPWGEDAMDRRFEALRMDISAMTDQIVYAIYKSVGASPSKPTTKHIESFQIFQRMGKKTSRGGNFQLSDAKDQQEVATKMKMFASQLRGRNQPCR